MSFFFLGKSLILANFFIVLEAKHASHFRRGTTNKNIQFSKTNTRPDKAFEGTVVNCTCHLNGGSLINTVTVPVK